MNVELTIEQEIERRDIEGPADLCSQDTLSRLVRASRSYRLCGRLGDQQVYSDGLPRGSAAVQALAEYVAEYGETGPEGSRTSILAPGGRELLMTWNPKSSLESTFRPFV